MRLKINYGLSMAILWKRPKTGTYYAQWQENGKARRKALCFSGQRRATKDKRIAIRLFNQFQRELIAGKVKPISEGINICFFDFVNEFLTALVVSEETLRLYNDALKKAQSCWGNIPLGLISSKHLDKLISDMFRAGLKAPTINKNFRHVKAALKKAQKWKYIKYLDFPKQITEEEKDRYFTVEDLRQLMKTITDQEFYDFCLFAGYTGLRSGEIIRLTWKDIDQPSEGYIHVSSKQKNRKVSTIPIHPSARAILEQYQHLDRERIFRFKTVSWISQKFKACVRKAGLKDSYRFHDLRHTFASHLAMKGESLQAIQGLMRHKSYESTKRYAHLSPDYLSEVIKRLNYGPMSIGEFKK
ncbi:MAG TPA: site-specific integrase [Anaerolineae bacterium]|nr:site-specific integrase [Anaerolineae bacterium]